MKILILSDSFPPQAPGGAERSTFNLALAFQKKGHQVFVITTCREKKLAGEESLDGLKVFRIYANYHPRWRACLSLYNPQTVGRVKQLLRAIKPDVVQANNIHYYLSYFCLKLARQHSRAVFLTARDVALFNYGKLATKRYLKEFDYRMTWWDHLKQARKRYNPFRNTIIRHYLKYTDKIFAISNALKEALNKNGISNVEVIYNGINVEDWPIDLSKLGGFKNKYNIQNKKIILFGGRLSGLKGGDKILQAMQEIMKHVPETVLLVVGKKNDYTWRMLNSAKRLNLGDRVVFTDWLEVEQLKAAYLCADVVAVPSVCFDSFNLFNIEAMAVKKPVVGTCFGGTPEIIQDGVTGYVVNPFDTSLMAEKILDLLKNPRKAEEFGEAGYRRVVDNFNLERQADQYLRWFGKTKQEQ